MKQPLIIPVSFMGRERYQVFQEYDYLLLGEIETVPEGMIVDGASVPRFAWSFMPPDGLHRAGALPHDDIYGRRGVMPSGRYVSRKDADAVLYQDARSRRSPMAQRNRLGRSPPVWMVCLEEEHRRS